MERKFVIAKKGWESRPRKASQIWWASKAIHTNYSCHSIVGSLVRQPLHQCNRVETINGKVGTTLRMALGDSQAVVLNNAALKGEILTGRKFNGRDSEVTAIGENIRSLRRTRTYEC